MKEDARFFIARIAMNITLKDLGATQDYALHVGKDIMMNGRRDYRER